MAIDPRRLEFRPSMSPFPSTKPLIRIWMRFFINTCRIQRAKRQQIGIPSSSNSTFDVSGIQRQKLKRKTLKKRIPTQAVRRFETSWALVLLSRLLVYSSALEWVPQGDQESDFADAPCKPANDNILLAKLRPGQVRMRLICLVSPLDRSSRRRYQ